MNSAANWHPLLDALFYSDVSAPESGYCLGDGNGFGACVADHRPRAMIFKWAVVVLMGSHFPKANSQLWLYNWIVWKTFKDMLMPESHSELFWFSWSSVLSMLWNFQKVSRSMKCTAGVENYCSSWLYQGILGKTRVHVVLKDNILNYSFWDTIFNFFTISSDLRWGCEGSFFLVLKGAIVKKVETQA